tara:strand:- start:42 stop:338 length:297 start_codon:yes stop_codon:yes gene_type:complete
LKVKNKQSQIGSLNCRQPVKLIDVGQMPVGCLVEHVNAQALIDGVSSIVHAKEPKKEFDKFKEVMQASLPDRNSTKHMVGLDLGRMEPTPSLKYQVAA